MTTAPPLLLCHLPKQTTTSALVAWRMLGEVAISDTTGARSGVVALGLPAARRAVGFPLCRHPAGIGRFIIEGLQNNQ